jgi:hypothetical protein
MCGIIATLIYATKELFKSDKGEQGERRYQRNDSIETSTFSPWLNINQSAKSSQQEPKVKKKTQTELDRELEMKMAGLAGDGGEAGLELEDGKAVSMKRSVRENMFRYI